MEHKPVSDVAFS